MRRWSKRSDAISVAKGFDPREYLLVAFGGAGGQHACAIAAELDMPAILCHPDAGLLSAYGYRNGRTRAARFGRAARRVR